MYLKSRPLATFAVAGLTALLTVPLLPARADAASLAPSRSGLMRQVRAAQAHDYTHLQNDTQVRDFVRKGLLVHLPGNRSYRVKHTVRHTYARPEVKLFIERLSEQYRAACGEQLVVTSLVRPKSRQPRNSSPLSVHPTGMAMDLRISSRRSCRQWLESALVGLEANGVLEAARERHPPHYHVVLFPRDYVSYVAKKVGPDAVDGYRTAASDGSIQSYRVRPGDNLWTIARRHGTTVASIRQANNLRSNRIKPQQVLKVPVVAR